MITDKLPHFLAIAKPKRLLAIDISKKRIGLAVSDISLKMALPLKVIKRSKFNADVEAIKVIYNDYQCGGVVAGYPIELDGTEGPRCQAIKDFVKLFLTKFEVPVFFENEQFSTAASLSLRLDAGLRNKKPVDDLAATYFLQSVLDKAQNIY